MPGDIDRRGFLRVGALFSGAAFLAACGGDNWGVPQKEGSGEKSEEVIKDPAVISMALGLGGGTESFSDETLGRLLTNGLRVKQTVEVSVSAEGNQPVEETLLVLKGRLTPNVKSDFIVATTKDFSRWYKIAVNGRSVSMLEKGLEARLALLEQFSDNLPDNFLLPRLVQIQVEGQTLKAIETGYLGETLLADLLKGVDYLPSMKQMYEEAFQNTILLLAKHGYVPSDVNPGNIFKLNLKDGTVTAVPFDFEERFITRKPTNRTVDLIIEKFKMYARSSGLTDFDLEIPEEVGGLLLSNIPGKDGVLGRVLIEGEIIEYTFSARGLKAKDVIKIRDEVMEILEGGTVFEQDEVEVVLEISGKEVILTRIGRASFKNGPAFTSAIKLLGLTDTLLFMSIGTVEISGLGGPEILANQSEEQIYQAGANFEINIEEIYNQIEFYKQWLIANSIAQSLDAGPLEVLEGISDPTVRFYIQAMLGGDPNETYQEYVDWGVEDGFWEDVKKIIGNSPFPFKMKISFPSPFPGIPGSDQPIPLWASAFEYGGKENLVLWASDWESLIRDNQENPALQVIYQAEFNRQSSRWERVFEDKARMGAGIVLKDFSPNSNLRCMLYVPEGNQKVKLSCELKKK